MKMQRRDSFVIEAAANGFIAKPERRPGDGIRLEEIMVFETIEALLGFVLQHMRDESVITKKP